jgi:transposase
MEPCLAVGGATTGEVFDVYSELRLGPALRPGEVIMDNLSSHKGGRVRELTEERSCELSTTTLYLPPYSPDLNPISGRPSPSSRRCCRE